MTTAHRATWKAARGGLQEEGSFRLHVPSAAISSKDAPTEVNLKIRAPTEASRDELRTRLETHEQPLPKRPRKSRFGPQPAIHPEGASPRRASVEQNRTQNLPQSDDINADEGNSNTVEASPQGTSSSGAHLRSPESEDGASEADSDDDEADLLAELEKIRREREYERARKQAEEEEDEEQENIAHVAAGNPLINPLAPLGGEISDTASIATGSVPAFAVRRRWNDDVIFRYEATPDRSNKQRFINDTIRNDFHRKFMKRHVK